MKIYSTKFKGLKIIKIKKFSDLRGSVIKVFNKNKKYSKFNCFESYISFSKKGAVRGLHGQLGAYSQEKIIYCLKGKARMNILIGFSAFLFMTLLMVITIGFFVNFFLFCP